MAWDTRRTYVVGEVVPPSVANKLTGEVVANRVVEESHDATN